MNKKKILCYGIAVVLILFYIAVLLLSMDTSNVSDVYFILYQIKPSETNQTVNCDEHKTALEDFITLFGSRVSKPNENIYDLGTLTIERHFDDDPSKAKMNANIKIAYIEKTVSGKKVKE